MRRISLLFIFTFSYLLTLAVPARPVPVEISQEDGTRLSLFIHGDESFHFYTTDDNIPLIQESGTNFYYALRKENSLANSKILAHNVGFRTPAEERFILENKDACLSLITETAVLAKERHEMHTASFQNNTRSIGERRNHAGNKKGLVILVNFADKEMTVDNPANAFNKLFNEPGYSQNNHVGSVHDYFYDQSYGNFNLTFDVVGPVTVSHEMAYYGKNDPITGSDSNPREMIAEACRLADEFVDFKDYDWDGDGEVDQVFVIYAGYGESNGAPANTIWPHESVLYGVEENNFRLDGTRIYTYACSSELADNSGSTISGIGTPCHEFSHCLGIPDFYDVNYNGGFGMSAFDLMDSGSHNGPEMNGEIPCGYSAYERWFAGWLDFSELSEIERISDMPSLQDSPVAYKIVNDNHPDEYFILENRQPSRWYSYLRDYNASGGLLIYHVDYSASNWTSNKVNTNKNHQRMSVVPADGSYGRLYESSSRKRYIPSAEEFHGDFFPGLKNVMDFNNSSHINTGGTLFNQNIDGSYSLNKPLSNIKESEDGLISFDFMGGIFVPVPYDVKITEIKENGFSVEWSSADIVDFYSVEATEIRKKTSFETSRISENFIKFISTQTDKDGKFDLSVHIDSYTSVPGWKSRNIFTSAKGVKIGSEDSPGMLVSPSFESLSGTLTLKLSFSSSVDSSSPLSISLIEGMQNPVFSENLSGSTESTTIIKTIDNLKAGYYTLKIECDDPHYISGLYIYDEEYSEDELKSTLGGISSLIKPVEVITDNNVVNTYYEFENLKATKYKFRVKASKDEAYSGWSDYIEVNLDAKDAVGFIYDDVPGDIRVYDVFGRCVKNPTASGIYVIRKGTRAKKILAK